jgi:hypothetical protein
MHPDATLSGREQTALAQAKTAHGSRRRWQVGAGLGGLGTLMVTTTTALGSLFNLGAWWLVLGLFFALPMIALLVTALRRASDRHKTTDDAIDAAWRSAAHDIAQQATHGITAEQLAEHLGTTAAVAEQLLTALSIEDKVQSHITDEGQLMYTAGLRIEGAHAAELGLPQPKGLDAELEALAAEHEAAELRQHNKPLGDV